MRLLERKSQRPLCRARRSNLRRSNVLQSNLTVARQQRIREMNHQRSAAQKKQADHPIEDGSCQVIDWLGLSHAGEAQGEQSPVRPVNAVANLNMPGLMPTLLVAILRYVTIPTAIGALLGYAWRGFLLGVMLFMALIAWVFFALMTWGGT